MDIIPRQDFISDSQTMKVFEDPLDLAEHEDQSYNYLGTFQKFQSDLRERERELKITRNNERVIGAFRNSTSPTVIIIR